jgi:hypothetical protein
MLKSQRRFHRIKMNAQVYLMQGHGVVSLCCCIDFSEDGIDLEIIKQYKPSKISIGEIVQVKFDQVEQAPTVKAAVIKVSPNIIGLRLL